MSAEPSQEAATTSATTSSSSKSFSIGNYFALPKFGLAFFQQLVGEFLATFFFAFVMLGNTLTENLKGNTTLVEQLFSDGMAAFLVGTAATYSLGQISGAQMTPILTFALMVTLRMNWVIGIIYIIVQFLAVFAALGLLIPLFPVPDGSENIANQLVLKPIPIISDGADFFLQFIGAFVFILLYLFFRYDDAPTKVTEGMDEKAKTAAEESQLLYFTRQNATPLFIGFIYGALFLLSFNVNPWLSLAPCMVAHECGQEWIYCVGGFLGALVGALLFLLIWDTCRKPKTFNASKNPIVPPVEMDY